MQSAALRAEIEAMPDPGVSAESAKDAGPRPDGASGAGRTRTSGKLRVCRHGAINDLATPPNHGPLKRREVRHIHLRVTKVDRYATGIVLQVPAQTGVPD